MTTPEKQEFETEPQEVPTPPAREMSQAAIASFFYGTLQLLVTAVGAVLTVIFGQFMKTFNPVTSQPSQGTDITLEEVQKLLDSMNTDGSTDPSSLPSLPPITTTPAADPALIGPTVPADRANVFPFMPQPSPNEIAPLELLIILGCSGFAIMSIITALIAFRATGKGMNKNGKGLAVTGLISSVIAILIAFGVALMM